MRVSGDPALPAHTCTIPSPALRVCTPPHAPGRCPATGTATHPSCDRPGGLPSPHIAHARPHSHPPPSHAQRLVMMARPMTHPSTAARQAHPGQPHERREVQAQAEAHPRGPQGAVQPCRNCRTVQPPPVLPHNPCGTLPTAPVYAPALGVGGRVRLPCACSSHTGPLTPDAARQPAGEPRRQPRPVAAPHTPHHAARLNPRSALPRKSNHHPAARRPSTTSCW